MATEFTRNSRPAAPVPLRKLKPQRVAPATKVADEESPRGFNFQAASPLGHVWRLYTLTTTPDQAMSELHRAGLQVELLTPRKTLRQKRGRLPNRVELAQFAEQFGDQFEAGETPAAICEMLGRNHSNKMFAAALLNAAELIREGKPAHEAFAAQVAIGRQVVPAAVATEAKAVSVPVFPVTLAHAIRIGEDTGAARDEDGTSQSAMLLMMRQFAKAQTQADEIWSQIKGAMMYPLGVLGLGLIILVGVMYFVMPRFIGIYEAILPGNASLPLTTQILVSTSNFLTSWPGLATVITAIAGAITFSKWLWSPAGWEWLQRRYLFWPLGAGDLLRDFHAAGLLRNLAMLSAGQPDLKARLRQARQTADHVLYQEMLADVLHQFEEQAASLDVLFRPYTHLMGDDFHTVLLTYEKTGNMEGLFTRYAGVLERRLDRKVKLFLSQVKIYSIVPVAVLIGYIVIALYHPMFTLVGRLANK